MSHRAALLFCLLAPSSGFACDLQIRNASGVELSIPVGGGKSVSVGPGESARFTLQQQLWVDFGVEAHEYALSSNLEVLCPVGATKPVRILAQPNGTLEIDSPAPQPKGFPLRPVHVTDLTGSPSNNSFKPTPLRGAA